MWRTRTIATGVQNSNWLISSSLSLNYPLYLRNFVRYHLSGLFVDCIHDQDQHVPAKSRRKRHRISNCNHRSPDVEERCPTGAQTLPDQYAEHVRDCNVETTLFTSRAPHGCIIDISKDRVKSSQLIEWHLLADTYLWHA